MSSHETETEVAQKAIPFTGRAAGVFLLPLIALIWTKSPILPSLVLFATLWVLAVTDWHVGRLPNIWTFMLFMSGLVFSYVYGPLQYRDYLVGAIAGFLSIFVLSLLYKSIRGRDGMGMGDAKFMAGVGAWLGWQLLPIVLLTASLSALFFVVVRIIMGETYDKQSRLPFGPFLCVSVWFVWVFLFNKP